MTPSENSNQSHQYWRTYKLIWRIITISLRITSALCLALLDYRLLIYMILGHISIGVIYFGTKKLRSVQFRENRILYSLIFAAIFVIDFFNIYGKNCRNKMIIFYGVIVLENIGILTTYGVVTGDWLVPITIIAIFMVCSK